MPLLSQQISHKDVINDIQENSHSNYKLLEVNCPFTGMYTLKNFHTEDLYILFRKIGLAYRNDPNEYRAQLPDLNLSEYLCSENILRSNFIFAGFFKIIEEDQVTISFFNKIGETAKNRSYYVNINSIIDANSSGKGHWYNADGFKVSTVKSSLFFNEMRSRYD